MINAYINKFKKTFADLSYRKTVIIPDNQLIVSFTFDDVPLSGLKSGTEILEKHGKNGTFYFALSFLGEERTMQSLYTIEDVRKCVEGGHEAACHTYSHMHLFNTRSKSFIVEDLKKNQNCLSDMELGITFQNFSYPYGEQTRLAKSVLTNHYRTCRSNDSGVNVGKTDLNNLKSYRLYQRDYSLEIIYKQLEEFSKTGGWLIFYTHDVQENYSQYGCSENYLESVVKKCDALDLTVLSIKDAINQLGISN